VEGGAGPPARNPKLIQTTVMIIALHYWRLLNEVVVSGRLWAACRWRLLFGVLTQAVVGRWRPWCDMMF